MIKLAAIYRKRNDLVKLYGEMAEKAVHYYVSAAKSEGYRLKKLMSKYIRSHGRGTWRPYAPLTRTLRVHGAAKWFARFTRYEVGWMGKDLAIKVGIFRSKVKPPSKEVIIGAIRLSSGYRFRVTRGYQRYLAYLLREKGLTEKQIRRRIPKIGEHRVKPRPFVKPVIEPEKERIISNIRTLFLARLLTGRKIRR